MDNDCIDLEGRTGASDECPWCGAKVDPSKGELMFAYGSFGDNIEIGINCPNCKRVYCLVYHLGEAVS